MRKGLGVTLLTVAIAMMGFNAMSMAPVIEEIKSLPIVGDYNGATSANVFVFPDAVTLTASDDNTSASGIVWTFTVADPANPRYNLNGYGPVDLASAASDNNPNNPNGAKRIDQTNTGNSEVNPDTNPHTVTIRDRILSPFPAQASYADPAGGPGIVGTEVITLIASDGTTYSTSDFIAWTDDEGVNRYSGSEPGERLKDVDFLTTNGAFITSTWNLGGTFMATNFWSSGASGEGLCATTPAGTATSLYEGGWACPYGWFDLAANSVYKIRMEVEGSSTQVRTTPLWTIYIENYQEAATSDTGQDKGDNAYEMQVYELDNEGGANAAAASYGINTFYTYFAPVAVNTPQWNDASTGAFTAGYDATNDMRIFFRVLDAGANIVAQNRLGTLCMKTMTVDRFDYDAVTAVSNRVSTVYEKNTFSNTDGYVNKFVTGTQVTYNTDGSVTIAPPAAGWTNEVATLGPGNQDGFNLDSANIADNWPIAWAGDQLWLYEASISASDATNVGNPPDVLALRIDTPTYEVFSECQMQTLHLLGKAGMPTMTPATYATFFYTQVESATTVANYAAFRPIVEATSSTSYPQEVTAGVYTGVNKGGIRVYSMKVTELVKF